MSPAGNGAARWRTGLALLALPLLPAVATGFWHPRRPDWAALRAPDGGVRQVDLATARAEFPGALWIDARETAAYEAGHVPEALSLNETAWEAGFGRLMEAWDGARSIVVYCGGESCHASETVARRLKRELGFEKIVVLRGGWDAWRAAEGSK